MKLQMSKYFCYVNGLCSVLDLSVGMFMATEYTNGLRCVVGLVMVVQAFFGLSLLSHDFAMNYKYGKLASATALLDIGHFFGYLLGCSYGYTQQTVTASIWIIVLLGVTVMARILNWILYEQAFEKEESFFDQSRNLSLWRLKFFYLAMLAMSVITWALAVGRINVAVVPLVIFNDAIVGMIYAIFFFILASFPRFRRSFKGALSSLIGSVISFVLLGIAGLYYALYSKTKAQHMANGISLCIYLIFAFMSMAMLVLKGCVLEEPIFFRYQQYTVNQLTNKLQSSESHVTAAEAI